MRYGVAPKDRDIVEIVRSKHVAAQAPTGRKTLVAHMHGADADIIDRWDSRSGDADRGPSSFTKDDHVMIAPMDAMHERDHVSRRSDSRAPEPAVNVMAAEFRG